VARSGKPTRGSSTRPASKAAAEKSADAKGPDKPDAENSGQGREASPPAPETAPAKSPARKTQGVSARNATPAAQVVSESAPTSPGGATGAPESTEARAKADTDASGAAERPSSGAPANDRESSGTQDGGTDQPDAPAPDDTPTEADKDATFSEGKTTGEAAEAGIPGVPPGVAPGGGTAAPQTEPPAPPAPPTPPRRGGAGLAAMLLGGVLAGAIGFAAAWYLEREGWLTASEEEIAALEAELAAQQDRLVEAEAALAALRDDLNGVPETARAAQAEAEELRAGLTELGAELSALELALAERPEDAVTETRVVALEAHLDALDARMDAVERMPFDASEAAEVAVEAYRRDLAEMRAEIDALRSRTDEALSAAEAARAEAEARLTEAEAAMEAVRDHSAAVERVARAQTLLRQLRGAFDTGAPFVDPLDELAALGVQVPETLAAQAGSGVPTLAELQDGFPPAARAALSAALREVDAQAGPGERLIAFLRAQLGARSLTARDGDDPDAILSRAEAALQIGELEAAQAEIATLPLAARAHLDDWVARARLRQEAAAALADIVDRIESL
jgi:hypothetical protein